MLLEKSNIGFVQKSKGALDKIQTNYEYKLDFIDNAINKVSKLCNEPLNLAVMGEFNAGKSSFINKLLGIDLLPTGIVPKTATVIKVKYGLIPYVEILYNRNGNIIIEKSDDLHKIKVFQNAKDINNEEIATKIKSIKEIIIYTDKKLLKNFTFIDTPGFNHDEQMDGITRSIFNEVDLVIWLITKNQASKKTEIEELLNLKKHVDNIMLVVNKSDINNDEDNEQQIMDNIHNQFSNIISNRESIHFISSKKNLDNYLEIKFQNFVHDLKRTALEDDVRISEELLIKEFKKFDTELQKNLQKWISISEELAVILNNIDVVFNTNEAKINIKRHLETQFIELFNKLKNVDTKYQTINNYAKEYIAQEFFQNRMQKEISNLHSEIVTVYMNKIFDKIERAITVEELKSIPETVDIITALEMIKSGIIQDRLSSLSILGAVKFYIYTKMLGSKSLDSFFTHGIKKEILEEILFIYNDDLDQTVDILSKNQYISSKVEKLLQTSHSYTTQIKQIQSTLGVLND